MRLAAGLALAIALAAFPSAASAALQVSAPTLVPVLNQSGYVTYEVYATATGQYEHDRSEGAIVSYNAASDTTRGIRFTRDYRTKTKTLNLPHRPRPSLVFLAGETYSVTVHWLAGGGGCGTCDEAGVSPPTVVTVPGADPKSRVDLDRKLANAQCARILEDRVIANVLPSMLSFTDGMKKYYSEQQARDLAASRYCRQIAADPIDRRFRSTVKLRKLPASRFKPASAGSAGKPLAAVLAAGGRLAVELEAVSASINRAQGATKARKKRFERKQMLSAAVHAKNASAAARTLAAALPKAAAALQQSYPEIVGQVVSDQDLANARAQLAGGLPADQAAAFRRFGLPAAQIRQTGMIFNSTDTLGDVTLGTLMAGPDVIAMLKAEATAMRGLAAAWRRNPLGEL